MDDRNYFVNPGKYLGGYHVLAAVFRAERRDFTDDNIAYWVCWHSDCMGHIQISHYFGISMQQCVELLILLDVVFSLTYFSIAPSLFDVHWSNILHENGITERA